VIFATQGHVVGYLPYTFTNGVCRGERPIAKKPSILSAYAIRGHSFDIRCAFFAAAAIAVVSRAIHHLPTVFAHNRASSDARSASPSF